MKILEGLDKELARELDRRASLLAELISWGVSYAREKLFVRIDMNWIDFYNARHCEGCRDFGPYRNIYLARLDSHRRRRGKFIV